MMDGRRHSVDIPISKTLVALRRVRSLRDPSTNSLSKLSALVENLNWEANSRNGMSLGFINGCKDDGINDYEALGSKDLGSNVQRGEHVSDCEKYYYGSRKHNSKLVSCENSGWAGSVPVRAVQVEGSNLCRSNQDVLCENKSLTERYCSDYKDKGLDLTCITHSSDFLEDVGSCSEPIEGLAERLDNYASKRKSRHRKQIRSSRGAGGDLTSCIGSPCLSINYTPPEGSSPGTSLYGRGDVDVVDTNHRGCGISSCWSRTPRFRESNLPSDADDQPLLSGEGTETNLSGQRRGWKHIDNELTTHPESHRSLSQKFRPKYFNELEGQNVVARSLLSAISNGRVTHFNIFHGPRGTGKTSASRIFAAALNCLSLEDNRPCGLCQECILFFSGRSRDVKEVDSVRINRVERVRFLIKNATIPPVSSRFKVFIIDECHLLRGATWAYILNYVEYLCRHVVFIMITPDLDKLPRSAVSRSQRYHFPKIKEGDIISRLGNICLAEGLHYDQVALDFIASRSNGSLRDAEMMLEQLSLLGKGITLSLAYELVGIVSDDELLDLLDLALSSDTSNTVKKARELMRSRIDPMRLISQLANLIMDILAGKCQDGASEVKRKFSETHASESDLQQLSHALKILSETEKQLRTSKNQTTWLTVALLQLTSVGSSLSDANDSSLCVRTVHPRDGNFCSTSSTGENLKHLVTCACGNNPSYKLGIQDDRGTLESIWNRAIELCESNSLRNFLHKQGNLASVCFNQGLAVIELEFNHPESVSKAEKSWKLIASALQSTLGRNVEIRINLVHCTSVTKYGKVKKPSLSLFSCSRRMRHDSQSTTEQGSDPLENSNSTSEKPMIMNSSLETRSSDCGSQILHICCHRKEAARTIRNSDGNALSVGITKSSRLLPDNMPKQDGLGVDSSKEEESNCGCQSLSPKVPENQPSCFSRTVKLHKKLHSADTSQMSCLRIDPQNNLMLSVPSRTSSETCFCGGDPHIFCSSCKIYNSCTGVEERGQLPPKLPGIASLFQNAQTRHCAKIKQKPTFVPLVELQTTSTFTDRCHVVHMGHWRQTKERLKGALLENSHFSLQEGLAAAASTTKSTFGGVGFNLRYSQVDLECIVDDKLTRSWKDCIAASKIFTSCSLCKSKSAV